MAALVCIGYVPEHYLLPLHLAKSRIPFECQLVPFPSGTGHMITSLRSGEIDIAIGLTEGWVAGLLNSQGQKEQGYNIVGSFVRNPLRWAIVTGRDRDDINSIDDLRNHLRVGVSRLGSGSHVMSFVLAQQEGWLRQSKALKSEGLVFVPCGPFKDLRDAVTGKDGRPPTADFFMWEHFTTKAYFDGDETPLKKIGEIYTPWPSWHIVASTAMFPDPNQNQMLASLFTALDEAVTEFDMQHDECIRMLGTGELGCHYSERDAREWLKDVEFYKKTRGVDPLIMEGVVKVLKVANVIEPSMEATADDGVVGIIRQ